MYTKRLSSVLVLGELYKCEKCDKWHIQQAAGFLITRDGVFVTNHHVFDDKKGDILVAMTSDGHVYPVLEVLAASKHDDVAIARIKMEDAPVVPLRADAPVGSPVSLISHPDGRFYMYTQGHIARYSRLREHGGVATRMAVTADFARGSSGAPLFDRQGNAVGMVCSTRSVYYAADRRDLQMVFKQCIPARAILGLIDSPEGSQPPG
jgi:S1-C subfamily serine protease